jgi:hypothetical protein
MVTRAHFGLYARKNSLGGLAPSVDVRVSEPPHCVSPED